ncbi:GntR family transcriptional regulator [Desulfitibacter alkalitolerans]|uniref:GntR family transcriptional regulator n=1 Tax=Desulfitibacter alkalitolerans TaxID=264641 RepID=UPI000688D499|nr:GntR family transcriptional regulator [Desulfitibacter alkalitolerans]
MNHIIPKVDSEQLFTKVRKLLLDMLETGAFANTEKLPSEENLAKSLGVSRSVLRDVLAIFEAEGYITRKRGIGTLVNRHIINAVTRLDIEKEFMELINDAGYTPKIAFVNVEKQRAASDIAQGLAIDEGQEIIAVERLVLADNMPAILCTDHIASSLVLVREYSNDELFKPIFYFLEKYCNEEVVHNLTKVEPVLAKSRISSLFNIEEGVPLFYMSEVGYNIYNRPVLLSKEYHNPKILSYSILRKKF